MIVDTFTVANSEQVPAAPVCVKTAVYCPAAAAVKTVFKFPIFVLDGLYHEKPVVAVPAATLVPFTAVPAPLSVSGAPGHNVLLSGLTVMVAC